MRGYKLLSLSMLLVSNVLIADEYTQINENEYYTDLSTFVSATRIPQRQQELPTAVTVIDRKIIESSSAIDVIDLFRLVPGMRVAYANGNIHSISYHGYASAFPNRMQALIDGRSVFTPLFSIVDWNNIGLKIDDIERIEIVRGSNSASYGANAVLGTINIITSKPFLVSGHTASVTYGDIETKKYMYRYANSDQGFEQKITLSGNRDDGFEGVDDFKQIDSLNYRAIYSPVFNQSYDLQLGVSGGPVGGWGVPGTTGVLNLSPVRVKDTNSHYEALQWRHQISNDVEQVLNITNNYLSWDDEYVVDLSLPPASLSGENSTLSLYSGNASRTEVDYQQTYTKTDNYRVMWGLGYKVDRLKNRIILNRSDYLDVKSQRIFTHLEKYLSERAMLNLGVMGENNGLVGFYQSPRLSLNYFINSGNTIRLSASRAKRTPSLYEYYNDNNARLDSSGMIIDIRYKSSPDLKEETLKSYELGYLGSYFGHRLNFDAKAYIERLDDIIRNTVDNGSYPDPFGSKTWVWNNAGYTINKGVEFQVKYTDRNGWLINGQYAYAKFSGKLINESLPLSYYPANKIEGLVPKTSYSVLLSKELGNEWKASVVNSYTSAMEWLGGGTINNVRRTDLMVSKKTHINNVNTRASVILQNISDDYYEFEGLTNASHVSNVFEQRVFIKLEVNI